MTIIIPYCISAMISILTGVTVWRKGHVTGTGPFILLALFEGEWTVTYIFQTLSRTLPTSLFWNNAQFLGAVMVPLACFILSMELTGRNIFRERKWRIIFYSLAALMLIFIWTDSLHHLFRTNPLLVQTASLPYLLYTDGPLFSLFTIYSYGLICAGTFLLAASLLSASRFYRFQIGAVLIAFVIPWVTAILSQIQVLPIRLHNITPLTFGISNLIIGWALLKYQLFDMVPVARHHLVEKILDGVLVLDYQRRVVDCNPSMSRIIHHPVDQIIGNTIDQLAPELAGLDIHDTQVEQSKTFISFDMPEGRRIFHINTAIISETERGKMYLMLFQDETDQLLMEENLKKSISLMNATIESTAEAILILDRNQNIIALNRQYLKLFHLPENWAEIPDRHDRIAKVLSKVKEPKWYEARSTQLLEDLNYECTDRLEMTDGRVIERIARPYVVGGQTIGRLYTFMDITKRKKIEEKLEHYALTDPLTDMPNRRNFFSTGHQELDRAERDRRPFSILLFDVDRFSEINDTYGHIVGDQVLQKLSSFIHSSLREMDLIARFGGDEFVILLPATGKNEAIQTAERLRSIVSELDISTNAGQVALTLCFGVATMALEHDTSLDSVLDRADRALYTAKQQGRNQIYYSATKSEREIE